MNTTYPGKLISLEGTDGCGKSTLAAGLATALAHQGIPVVLTKEPGGTPLGTHLRNLLHNRPGPMGPKAEYLLLAADRAQHCESVVIPALQAGKLVISDRMNDSSMAYQGYGRGLDLSTIATINAWAMDNIKQDLIFYIDIDPKTAIARYLARKEDLTAFEQEKLDFWHRVRTGFQELFKNRPEVATLDGNQPQEILLQQALAILHERGIIRT